MSQKKKQSKTGRVADARKDMFIGNSEELKYFLQKKRKNLEILAEQSKSEKEANKLNSFVEMIKDVLKLKFFRYGKIRSMPELIEAVKEERDNKKEQLERFKKEHGIEVARLKAIADKAFEKAGKYMANEYELEYNTEEQIELRDAVEEYQIARYDFECDIEDMEYDIKVLWWLLGIIHRPVGFFKNVSMVE